jgi:hypothetical protein
MARTRFTARTFRAGIALTILAVSIAACKPPRVSPASAYWPSTPSNGPYWPVSLARGIAACPGGGGYIADAYGGIHAFTSNGLRPERVTQTAGYWPGRDIVRGLAVNSDCTGGWTLDSYGALQPFATGGHALPPIPNVTTYGPSTNARGVAYAADLRSGYVVDGNGRFFPFALPGNALPGPAVLTSEYETATSDWVRGATLSPDGRTSSCLAILAGVWHRRPADHSGITPILRLALAFPAVVAARTSSTIAEPFIPSRPTTSPAVSRRLPHLASPQRPRQSSLQVERTAPLAR